MKQQAQKAQGNISLSISSDTGHVNVSCGPGGPMLQPALIKEGPKVIPHLS